MLESKHVCIINLWDYTENLPLPLLMFFSVTKKIVDFFDSKDNFTYLHPKVIVANYV